MIDNIAYTTETVSQTAPAVNRLTASLVIPTYHRPDELAHCLRSVLIQTRLPREVVIVDDGALDAVPLRADLEAAGIRVTYSRKDKPGLAASRNVGIRLSSSNVIFMLDDDVVLEPGFVEGVMAPFEQDRDGHLGGVAGVITNRPHASFIKWLIWFYDYCFFISGPVEGRVTPSGFTTSYGETPFREHRPREVDFLPGGLTAYRATVHEKHLFSENYAEWGARGEDKDFSYRVSREYRLLVTPAARLAHYESARTRGDTFHRGRIVVFSRWRFFRLHQDTGIFKRALFAYSMLGFTLRRALWMMLTCRRHEALHVRGMLSAQWEIIRGRFDIGGLNADDTPAEFTR